MEKYTGKIFLKNFFVHIHIFNTPIFLHMNFRKTCKLSIKYIFIFYYYIRVKYLVVKFLDIKVCVFLKLLMCTTTLP